MANPRKFSEKIALHNQKQAEETAKFEQIMREVSDVTAKPDQQDVNPLLTMLGNDMPQTNYRESRNRSMGVGPMRPGLRDRRIDTSPYSGPYLSPPPDTSWRRTNSDSALHQSAMQGSSREGSENSGSRWNLSHREQNDTRPRSSCDIPRVPGINIYPSAQEPGIVQIPIGNNTGSLPDLTSVHFPSPLHTPLDHEADHSSSPYSSNHLSVPMNSRYLHHNKGVTLENSVSGLVDAINYTQPNIGLCELQNMYQQQCPTSSPSPTLKHPPGSGPSYRSPMPRPSPQSSPGLGGRHSAPSSPAAPSPIPDYYLSHAQATLLQQHFEQFSMMDSPSPYNMDQPNNSPLSDVTSMVSGGGNDLAGGAQGMQQGAQDPTNAYYTTTPSLVYNSPSLHTTPNTPTSIPDIILTDFSNPNDEISRSEFSKELSNVISGALDGDPFLSDESLREGLGAIDFDGLQMLSDPDMNVISDSAEDHLRLDRL